MTNARSCKPGLVALLLLFTVNVSSAAEDDPFVVRNAEFTFVESLMMLDMAIDSVIPEYISIALDQGFSVPIMFEVEILAHKPYWFDDRVVSLKQQYLLHHQPMLDSYVVFDVNNSERRYFDSRDAALRFIEVVYEYPLFDIANLDPGRKFYARLRFGIDSDELPLPLKSSSLWDNDWDLKSDWYEWEVERP